jgi:tetratricopeptide (TPR) repeat protein
MRYFFFLLAGCLVMPNVFASQLSSDTTSSEFLGHGKAKLGNKEYAESIRFFSRALQMNPAASIAYRYKGDAEKMLKKYEESIESYGQSLRINPNDTLALVGRAVANRLAGKLDDALVDFQNAIKLTPNDAKLHFGRGSVFLRLKKFSDALPDYDVSVSAFPTFRLLLYDRGLIYFNLGRYKEAIADLKNYSRYHSSQSLSPFFLLGLSFKHLNQVDSAIKYFNIHVSANKSDSDGYVALADCYSEKMDSVTVDSLFERINELELDKSKLFTNWGAVEVNLKRYERAIKHLMNAKELGEDSREIYGNLGNAQLGMKDTTSAIQSFSKAISLDKTYRDAYVSRLEVYMNRKNSLKLAIQDLSSIIKLSDQYPNNYVNYFFRSLCYAQLKKVDSSRLDLQTASSMAPQNAYSYAMRALVNMFLNEQPEKIIADLSQAIKFQNSYWEAYVLRAKQYADLGQHKKACVDMKKAVELDAPLTQEIKDYLCKGTLKNGKPPSINIRLTPP